MYCNAAMGYKIIKKSYAMMTTRLNFAADPESCC